MVPGSGKWGETCNIAQRLCGSQELGEGRASGGGGGAARTEQRPWHTARLRAWEGAGAHDTKRGAVSGEVENQEGIMCPELVEGNRQAEELCLGCQAWNED